MVCNGNNDWAACGHSTTALLMSFESSFLATYAPGYLWLSSFCPEHPFDVFGKSSALYGVLQAAESRHAAAVESLKEGWVGELKQQKEAWAAAEKGRRDTWLADKTKQVKELTVKVRPTSAMCLVRLGCVQPLHSNASQDTV